MSERAIAYPFVPKSTRPLKRGQFWSIPLASGLFGAGCVVGRESGEGKPSRRSFVAGVVCWLGTREPTAADLEGLPLLRFAFAHLKVITESGGLILGEANLQFGEAPEAAEALSLSTWGYGVPRVLAEKLAMNAVTQ
ncbi:hypothetical protein [Andreprevotia lacus]|jgi:hypothetical protein|uniref:hypothetical protein n=1 Tax=Andreprevotia lacus TaxID=1121000 RepID=UPI00111C4445|nr:hypothetical protein [Andreprevotia lacus]